MRFVFLSYPVFSTRLASRKKSFRLVPINDKQYTATFKEFGSSGVLAMSQGMISLRAATKSIE